MTFLKQNLVYVYYQPASDKILMGRLLLKDRKIFFEYDTNFIKTGLKLSPFKLPLKTGVIISSDPTFGGLFGIFNDSLPDGWGRLLLDRKLMHGGINPADLSPLDRLCYIGNEGMGALCYEPEHLSLLHSLLKDLDEINYEIQTTLNESDAYIDELFALGGSSGGARPKVLLTIDNEDWIIKFRSSIDPKDIGCIEYAYHLMALEAGLDVPKAKLFPSKKTLGFFGVKRFDRKKNKKIHMHTISGLIHADHRDLSLDYETIMKTTLYLTNDVKECEIQFRNTVFNILSHNRDDHSKNFSFLMDKNGVWNVSPAYDLTFSSGPFGEHSTTIMGEGKNPKQDHLLKLAAIGNIKKNKALEIIERVFNATLKWPLFAQQANVSKSQTKNIQNALTLIKKFFT